MSSPLSQDLAAKIIEVLVSRGHVLLSKGGRPALVREVADRTNDTLATIIGRMPPPGVVDNEVTSTFGDESLDDTVEEMVEDVTSSLMDSDHVEDVFSEDAVIRRDVFRVVKDALLSSQRAWGEAEEADVEVTLESLGYVAAKAAQRADIATVEGALSRAARSSQAKLLRYSPETRTATFRAALASPDARLELEEAVADELGTLVDEGKVALPTIERKITLPRAVNTAERASARPRIDVAASKTLLRSGCTATWEFVAPDTVAVTLVPMSEQDGRAVEAHVEAFARELHTILGTPREPAAAGGLDAWTKLALSLESKVKREKKAAPEEPPPASAKAGKAAAREGAPASKRTAEGAPSSRKAKLAEEGAAPPSRKPSKAAVELAPPSPRKAAPKRAVEAEPPLKKTSAKKAKAPREAKPGTKKTVAKKTAEKKAAEKKAKPRRAEPKPAAARKTAKAAPRSARTAPRSARSMSKSTRSVSKSARPAPRSARSVSKSARPASRSARSVSKSARPAPRSARSVSKSARPAPRSARSVSKSARPASRSARKAPKSVRTAPTPARKAPKSVRAAPTPARKAPKSVRTAPTPARKAPKSVRAAPTPARKAPRSLRTGPRSARTAPKATRSAPGSARATAKKGAKKAARR